MEAILHYEQWTTTGDDALLAEITAYNEDDCRATLALLDWLHGLRPPDLVWPAPPVPPIVTGEAAEALEA